MTTRSETAQPTVLIVDKDFKQVLACKNMLETHGYRVMCTHSGREALELCKQEKIDLVVTEALLRHARIGVYRNARRQTGPHSHRHEHQSSRL